MSQTAKRIWYLDYLRAFAALFVILLHVSATAYYGSDVTGLDWQFINLYDSIATWVVPVFVMVSGASFLGKGKNLTLKDIFFKYVLRLITAYLFWSLIYGLLSGASGMILVGRLIGGHYHLWYIPLIIGIYLLIPFFEKLVESERLAWYFGLLAAVCGFLIPSGLHFLKNFRPEALVPVVSGLQQIWGNASFHFTLGFTGYFVLGYLLNKTELSRKAVRIIYLLGVLSFCGQIFINAYVSIRNRTAITFANDLPILAFMQAMAVFVWFKNRLGRRQSAPKWVKVLAGVSFGVYLVHPLVIMLLNKLGIHILLFTPALSIPLLTLAVFVLSATFTWLLKRIPVVRKYIV